MNAAADPHQPRLIHPLLLICLWCWPILFVWFLFGKGYARSTRRAALIYTFAIPALFVLFAAIDWAIHL